MSLLGGPCSELPSRKDSSYFVPAGDRWDAADADDEPRAQREKKPSSASHSTHGGLLFGLKPRWSKLYTCFASKTSLRSLLKPLRQNGGSGGSFPGSFGEWRCGFLWRSGERRKEDLVLEVRLPRGCFLWMDFERASGRGMLRHALPRLHGGLLGGGTCATGMGAHIHCLRSHGHDLRDGCHLRGKSEPGSVAVAGDLRETVVEQDDDLLDGPASRRLPWFGSLPPGLLPRIRHSRTYQALRR